MKRDDAQPRAAPSSILETGTLKSDYSGYIKTYISSVHFEESGVYLIS